MQGLEKPLICPRGGHGDMVPSTALFGAPPGASLGPRPGFWSCVNDPHWTREHWTRSGSALPRGPSPSSSSTEA